MDKQSRKAITQTYKDRKVPVGIFTLRCEPTNEVWVGASRNLEGAANGAMFSLRMGSFRNGPLQAAWKLHGEAAFAYDVAETLEEDASPIGRETWLKDRLRYWIATLEGRPVVL